MANRHDLRALYIKGCYESDSYKLIATTARSFIFDYQAEAAPVTR
jgi:hypothetical protein